MGATVGSLDLVGSDATDGRRLIVVVYADMANYSRLIGLDDADTLHRLNNLRHALIDPAIREFGGKLVQTGGDSLLIAFGSIDGAVRFAVKVQQEVPRYDEDQPPDRRIRFRMGINIGDAIPEGTNLHGEGVNIAARLEAECPVGGICVSRSVRDHVHGRLDLSFESIGILTLKNIARPVEAFVVRLDSKASARHWRKRKRALTAGTALILIVAGAGWWLEHGLPVLQVSAVMSNTLPSVGLANAPRLSIAVLPLGNLSGDPRDDYLAEGITEDITTDLSRVPGMFVISRQSAYTYQGKTIDVRKVGDELGVRYVLEGSVRRVGDVLRVNTQLIATATGAHLWADRFDQRLDDLGNGQEAIVQRIGETLDVALNDIELARSKRESPANPDVFDTVLRIRSLFLRGMGPEEHARRKSLLEQAVKLDPTNVYVLTQLAYELERAQNDGIGDEAERARAARLLAEAEAINPTDINVLGMKAVHLFRQRRYDECVTAYRRLLDEYSNTDWGYYGTGLCQVQSGRPEDAIRNLQMALRLDPRSPMNYDKYGVLGNALLMAEHYQESITANERAFTLIRTSYTSLRAIYELRIAVAHERLGDIEQAHQALEQANRIWPYDTVRSHYPADLSSKFLIAFVTRYKETLRQLGQRDHAKEDADFDVPSDDNLREDYAGLTPNTVPGAKTIYTAELQRLLEKEQPIVIDPLLYSWGRSIPGAVGLSNAGSGGSIRDPKQERLRKKLTALTKGDHARPIVAVGWNSERFDGRNLALRLIALGYTDVYWYRGGREAWEAAGLPETDVAMQDW